MKKFLIIILFFFPQISNSFESLSLLTDIPINLKSNPQKALKSLYEYNDSICEIWFYKNKKDTMHTEVRFKLSQNLSELYSFLSSFEREVAIRCSPYIYKFKSIDGDYYERKIFYNFDICKNKIIGVELTVFSLSDKLFGAKPLVLKNLIDSFAYYSNKQPQTEIYEDIFQSSLDEKKYKRFNEKIVWKDEIDFENDDKIFFSIVEKKSYLEKNGKDSANTYINATIRDFGRKSRCMM